MTDAQIFVRNMTYEDFVGDNKTVYAVIRALEIIGEASKNVPPSLKARYSEIPWKEIAGMRDKVIHAYSSVDLKRVWSTVDRDIPALQPAFERILKENDANERLY